MAAEEQRAIHDAFRASLGPWSERAERLVSELVSHGLGVDDLEASLRGGASLDMSAGRMMLESQSPSPARSLVAALVSDQVDLTETWIASAQAAAQPLITGWDVSGARPVAKLYVNLSDASAVQRERLCANVIGLSGQRPHVIGVNVDGAANPVKLYDQTAAAPEQLCEPLRMWLADSGLCPAGYVTSSRVDHGQLVARAYFVGLRNCAVSVADLVQRAPLPGWSHERAQGLAPFEAGTVTSVGFSAAGDTWTIYYKPASHSGSTWSLDPVACFRSNLGEIGIYVAPYVAGQRAYATAAGYAVSYRVREGTPPVHAIEALMTWVVDRVTAGADLTVDPPDPWHVV